MQFNRQSLIYAPLSTLRDGRLWKMHAKGEKEIAETVRE
jgi:hypothetical protein